MTQKSISLLQELQHLFPNSKEAQDIVKQIITLENLARVSKPAKFNCRNYLTFCKEAYPLSLRGVLYENGNAVISDGHFLAITQTEYPANCEGKIIAKDGTEIDGKYPDYKGSLGIIKQCFNDTVNLQLKNITSAREAQKANKKFNTGPKIRFIEIAPHVYICMKYAKLFADFCKTYNAGEARICRVDDNGFIYSSWVYVETDSALLAISGTCPDGENLKYCYRL